MTAVIIVNQIFWALVFTTKQVAVTNDGTIRQMRNTLIHQGACATILASPITVFVYVHVVHFFFLLFFLGFLISFGGTLTSFLSRLSNLSKESGLFVDLFLDEFGIGQSLSRDHRKHRLEAVTVVVASVVESKRLFVQIAEQVRDVAGYIRATKRTLEQRPKVLDTVRVDISPNVFGRVVNVLVNVFIHALIGWQGIGEKVRACLNAVSNSRLKGSLFGVGYNSGFYLAGFVARGSLQQAEHNRLANSPATLYAFSQLVPFVHVFNFAANA